MSSALTSNDNNHLPAYRLKVARQQAGYTSAAKFADAIGMKPVTYQHHENGRRGISPETACLYAQFLKQPVEMFLDDDSLQSIRTITIVGRVGSADGNNMGKTIPLPLTVQLPAPQALVGHVVTGDDNDPIYREGDIVFHRPLIRRGFDVDLVHGQECVVEMKNGEKLLRKVIALPNGRANLIAWDSTDLNRRDNAIVVAAAPIEIVQRRLHNR